jgi:hypothetical protein
MWHKFKELENMQEFLILAAAPIVGAVAAASLKLLYTDWRKLLFIGVGFTLVTVGAKRTRSARRIMSTLRP